MILKETRDVVQVIENPLASTKPRELKAARIDKRTKSPTSLMPKGLPDKLTREEVLDLLAYVVSGANAKHKVFQGGTSPGTSMGGIDGGRGAGSPWAVGHVGVGLVALPSQPLVKGPLPRVGLVARR
jgi:hypothetical protein